MKRDSLNKFKPVMWIFLVAVLYLSGAHHSVISFGQQTMMKSGLLDASPNSDGGPSFDYNFYLEDFDGKKIDFREFKGKVIFLNLWATWCGPCRSEMASIQKLYDKVDHDKIVFIMLSLDKSTQRNKVITYVKEKDFSFPVYMPYDFLSEQLQVPSIPTTFVISKNGTVDTKEVGMKNYDTEKFKKYLERLASQ